MVNLCDVQKKLDIYQPLPTPELQHFWVNLITTSLISRTLESWLVRGTSSPCEALFGVSIYDNLPRMMVGMIDGLMIDHDLSIYDVNQSIIYLVGGFKHFLFSIIDGIILSID